MKKKLRCIDILTSEGKTIFSLCIYDKEIVPEGKSEGAVEQKTTGKKENTEPSSPPSDEPLMTDAQKRYLFRLLAEQGLEEEKAHQHLKGLFQVDSLTEVTKFEASKMIERLIEENKGGKDHGSPIQQPNQPVPAV